MLLKFLEVSLFLLLLLMLKMGILCGIVCAMLIVCVQNVVLLATWFYKLIVSGIFGSLKVIY